MKTNIGIILLLTLIQNLYSQNNLQVIPNKNDREHILKTDIEGINISDTVYLKYLKFIDDGMNKSNQGDYESAMEDFNQAILVNPNLFKAYLNRSVTYSKIGNYEKAFEDINKAINIDSNQYESYFNRGVYYKHIKLNDQAIKDFSKSIELNPDFPYPYSYIGECFLLKGEYKMSIEYLNRAIEIDPNNQEFYYSRSVYFDNMKEPDKAFLDLNKVISLNPIHKEALNNIGYYYYKNNQIDTAIFYYTCAIKVDSSDLRYWLNRARAYETKKEYLKAIKDLTYAINSLPTEKYFYKRRYDLLILNGQSKEAKKDLLKYKELDKFKK